MRGREGEEGACRHWGKEESEGTLLVVVVVVVVSV